MVETVLMPREDVIEELAECYVCDFMNADEFNPFVKGVLICGWKHTPYNKMTNTQLLAEWNKYINCDGDYPITIV